MSRDQTNHQWQTAQFTLNLAAMQAQARAARRVTLAGVAACLLVAGAIAATLVLTATALTCAPALSPALF